jgi:hypothetical protein
MKKRTVLMAFVVVQIVGIMCSWFSHHPHSSASSVLWGAGFIALFPGDILGSLLVEKLFWESHLAVLVTDLLTVAAVAAINAILWFAVAKVLQRIISRRSGTTVAGTTST